MLKNNYLIIDLFKQELLFCLNKHHKSVKTSNQLNEIKNVASSDDYDDGDCDDECRADDVLVRWMTSKRRQEWSDGLDSRICELFQHFYLK